MAGRPTKRDQIVDAARRCFHERGITATGVDTIAASAGVSKRTLYNHFPSKEDLVLAYVELRERRWRAILEASLEGVDDPLERVLVYFDCYFRRIEGEEFRGCSLINAAAEIPEDDNRVLTLLRTNKDCVHDEIAALVREAGLADPEATAAALGLLLEGSVALYGVRRDRTGLEVAKNAARRLMGASRDDCLSAE